MKNVAISREAQQFLTLIRTGRLPKAILPNSAPNYTLEQERLDTSFYVDRFLQTSGYDFIQECEAVNYDGE